MENQWTGGPAHRFPTTSLESHSAGTLRALPQPLGKTRTFSHSYHRIDDYDVIFILGKGDSDDGLCPLNADTQSIRTRTQSTSLTCPRSSESVSAFVVIRTQNRARYMDLVIRERWRRLKPWISTFATD